MVSSSGEDGRVLVRDTFGGMSVGQPQIALYDAAFDCDPDGMFELHLVVHECSVCPHAHS